MPLFRVLTKALAGLLAAGGLFAGVAAAQGFPSLTFEQMMEFNRRLILAQQPNRTPRPGDLFFNPGENGGGKTRVVYTGQSRPLDPRKSAFITAFASTSVGNDSYAALYEREYRFTSAGKEWWLPVQSQVASYFAKELKAGQPVTLYIRNAGGFRGSTDWEWIFLVEEFDAPGAPKDAPPAPPKPGQPPPRKAPPGPKIET